MENSKQIYLDYAAASPMDERVLAAMQPYFSDKFYNPSASYLAGQAVAADLQAARAKIAVVVGVQPREVVFTAGGTEANNLAIQGVISQYPRANVVVSAVEHDSVLRAAEKYDVRIAPVNAQGQIDLIALEKLIDDQTALVSIMYANNEIGTIQPLREVSRLIKSKVESRKSKATDLPLWFHTDACQAGAYLDIHISDLGVDMMTINGGKIYGPKQSGALIIKSGVSLEPQIVGGGQERGLRSGTENVAACVGLATALELVQSRRHEEVERLRAIQNHFMQELSDKFPDVVVNGSMKNRLPNNVHVTFPGRDNERMMMELDEKGIICAVGSACSASSDKPSHVLKAIGLTDEAARASLRFTMGIDTKTGDINRLVDFLR